MIIRSLSAVSFRDPAGFVYCVDGDLRRQVNAIYRPHYDHLMSSGLYHELVERRLLVPHEELEFDAQSEPQGYKLIRPERIHFISYPYEWCFSQYRDAALLTLEVERRALEHGMTLKDASAYNVQFHEGRPIFIDTLSFETLVDGEPWRGYRQFCEHFLAPLALMSVVDHRLVQLTRSNIDGIPLDLAARLLPARTRLWWGLGLHLHLHATLQRSVGPTRTAAAASPARVTRRARLALIDSLLSTIRGLRWRSTSLGWATYYETSTYTADELERKSRLVADFLDRTHGSRAWDLGANTGHFSTIACDRGFSTIAFDLDPACVERNYREARAHHEGRLLPLVLDLFNPSPGTGWLNRERASIFDRGEPDVVLALALVHHLAFTGNQPLENLADFFAGLGRWLVIEFVPETDAQAVSLIESRRGIHHPYDRERFEMCFGRHFETIESHEVSASGRRLYLMHRRDD